MALHGDVRVKLQQFVFRRIRKIAKSDYWLRRVCLFVRPSASQPALIELIGSRWTDFYEI
jgi:hypothetical protein